MPPTSNQPRGNKKPHWRNSNARKYLLELLKDGTIPLDGSMKPRRVFDEFCKDNDEFLEFNEYNHLFPGRLGTLREIVAAKYDRARTDEEALEHDRLIHPTKMHDGKGVPRWDGSPAKELLRKDLDNGQYPHLKPTALRNTKEEYQKFPPEFFRKKIHQEIATRKFIDQYCKPNYYQKDAHSTARNAEEAELEGLRAPL